MIQVYTGVPGGGKSLHAAQDVLDALAYKSVPVIANFNVNMERVRRASFRRKSIAPFVYVRNSDLTPEFLIGYASDYYSSHRFSESGILLVIDEAQLLFNSRSWNDSSRSGWVYFFTNSRHFGVKVVLITQFFDMLDKQIRATVEIEVVHRNMSNFGIMGRILALLVGGKLFVCVSYYCGLRQRINVKYVLGRRHLYDFYDSYDTESFVV